MRKTAIRPALALLFPTSAMTRLRVRLGDRHPCPPVPQRSPELDETLWWDDPDDQPPGYW